MKHVILIDFGSTYTKIAIVDCKAQLIIHTARFPSSVRTDAQICLAQCFNSARQCLGEENFEHALKLSSSSAAGGLRMAVIGLSPTLSTTAGKNAAFGAGAKIMHTFVGELTQQDVLTLEKLDIEIVLFCGGYEKGNTTLIEHNAQLLANSYVRCPFIYAGNSQIASRVRSLFKQNYKENFIVDNIIPDVDKLNTTPSEMVIRDVFMNHITNMKGLDKVQSKFNQPIIPTPAAVLSAGELLSRGTKQQAGMGALMIIDIGGATTDIHSYVDQTRHESARLLGSPEPYAKRTVEGDMGMRESSICLAEEVGYELMANELEITPMILQTSIQKRVDTTDFVAETAIETKIDHQIACHAAAISARRHAGYIEYIHSSNCTAIQIGKNITPIHTVIGTGGPIINSVQPKTILKQVCANSNQEANLLLPQLSNYYLDKHYVFYAAGLLRTYDEDLALTVMRNSLQTL